MTQQLPLAPADPPAHKQCVSTMHPRIDAHRIPCHFLTLALRLIVLAVISLTGCSKTADEAARIAEGARLANDYCQRCHQLPEPRLLSRHDWQTKVLPQMGMFLGHYSGASPTDSLFDTGQGGALVRAADIFPAAPVLPRAEWEAIVAYYLDQAPEALEPAERLLVAEGLSDFAVRVPDFRASPPMTSLVQIGARSSQLYVGDVKSDYSTLVVLDARGNMLERLGPLQAPTHLEHAADTLYVLEAGQLLPTDARSGRLVKLFPLPGQDKIGAMATVLDSLHRPVHFVRADLNGDKRPDFVVAEFGRYLGRLSLFEAKKNDEYRRQVLLDRPGATRVVVTDLTGDGRPDIVVLMAQGDEGIFLLENQGNSQYKVQPLVRFPPAFGSTSFDLLDLNLDGHLDILHTAGDNGDYVPPMQKTYHGVRGYLNDGANHFAEAFFVPIQGAYGVRASDFDIDGDLDLAVVAFYPGYDQTPGEGFIYLENEGQFQWTPSTFADQQAGRWMTIDAGDLDGDGDADLVLGSFVGLLEQHIPDTLQRTWLDRSPSVIILENTTQ